MPVVMVQNEVKKGNPNSLTVLVDAMVCVENVKRYAASGLFCHGDGGGRRV